MAFFGFEHDIVKILLSDFFSAFVAHADSRFDFLFGDVDTAA